MSTIKALNLKAKQMERTFEERGWRRLGDNIKRFLVPDRGRFLRSEKNDNETNYARADDRQWVLDDAAEQALNLLVSLFMSMLVSPQTKWLRLQINDPQLSDIKRVRVWLDDVTGLVLRVFQNADVYGALYNTFTEFISFATGCQILDSDEINTISPRSFTFGEYFIQNGPNQMPNTFCHKSNWTAKQLVEEFGEDNVSQSVKTAMKPNGTTDKLFLVWRLIEPNDGRTEGLSNPAKLPFNSVYWEGESSDQRLLRVSGYDEFPVQAPRWLYISNDTYGKESPGMKQLGNIKMLQSVTEDMLILSKRLGDPPMYSNGDFNQINSLPGGITYGSDSMGGKPTVSKLFDEDGDLQALGFAADRAIEQIKQGFYTHLSLTISDTSDTKRMTATEVVSRNEEKFAMLGPILNRVFNELLKPMIDRTFNILQRQGFFDEDGEFPVPPELVDVDLDIEFVSILAQAQKAVGLSTIDRYLERAGIASQLFPEALDKIDPDELMDVWGQNVPAIIMRDDEEVAAIREQRAQQQQAMAQMAAAETAASTAKDMSQAKLGGNSVLDAVEEQEA